MFNTYLWDIYPVFFTDCDIYFTQLAKIFCEVDAGTDYQNKTILRLCEDIFSKDNPKPALEKLQKICFVNTTNPSIQRFLKDVEQYYNQNKPKTKIHQDALIYSVRCIFLKNILKHKLTQEHQLAIVRNAAADLQRFYKSNIATSNLSSHEMNVKWLSLHDCITVIVFPMTLINIIANDFNGYNLGFLFISIGAMWKAAEQIKPKITIEPPPSLPLDKTLKPEKKAEPEPKKPQKTKRKTLCDDLTALPRILVRIVWEGLKATGNFVTQKACGKAAKPIDPEFDPDYDPGPKRSKAHLVKAQQIEVAAVSQPAIHAPVIQKPKAISTKAHNKFTHPSELRLG